MRAVTTEGVTKLPHATELWGALRHRSVTLSLDEHVVARFTRKFKIPKGFHTLSNKRMRAEKLFFLHWPEARRFLGLVATRGNGKLVERALDFLRAVRRRVQVRQLRLLIDRRERLRHRRGSPAPRALRQDRVLDPRAWSAGLRQRLETIATSAVHPYEKPGRYKSAKPKQIELAEATTMI
ncbi:hypothetical protein BE17_51500 [Sorangium cellulosum]|uniref:Uncharacterized protein n=1 Tax=Sorangium cellulosum TaxID=56 RepID=A0A150QWP4_SORCE|nr:hypothetical protein BE17_51500 [Sorangium cellulosum]